MKRGIERPFHLRAPASVVILLAWLSASGAAAADEIGAAFRRVTGSVVVVHTFERRPVPVESEEGITTQVSSSAGIGSGVLVSDDGLVATAAHVVQVADRIEVEFDDHRRVVAEVIGSSGVDDVAILKLSEPVHGVAPAHWGDSDRVMVGDPVFVVGAPYGLGHTLTAGRISARRPRGAGFPGSGGPQGELFQTDAAINRGNSGGPLFDEKGQLIGIVSFILSASGGFEGIGFAVTSNTVRAALISNRAVWTGMSGIIVSGDIAEALQLPQQAGYVIQQVARYSPAEAAGLRPGRIPATVAGHQILLGGDVILAVDGREVDGTTATNRWLLEYIGSRPAGAAVKLRVLRDGAQIDVLSYVPQTGSAPPR